MKRFALIALFLSCWPARHAAQESKPGTKGEAKPLPTQDDRYKADILLVVAHPDDEAAATPYLARAIDEGKRVAVVYGTHGSSGANEAGAEQAASLGAIREIEARRACATLGIANVWFLPGRDTATQNVVQSLANWGHAESLAEMVRLVRLTRAEVILTFLPGTFIGEDHGDHQASGVIATEAFDLAGDPSAFPEQVAAPMRRLEPYLENLRPWQPKKIYYFPDAANDEMFRGKGPEYSVKGISKSTKQPYWRVALEAFRPHETQAKNFLEHLKHMSEADIEKMASSGDWWSDAQRFVLGKSVVGGSVTGDMFENVTSAQVPFTPPERSVASSASQPELSLELAGPWSFYADFRRAHGLAHLWHPDPPEIALQGGTSLVIPLWLRNQSGSSMEVILKVEVPNGWALQTTDLRLAVGPKQTAATRVEINLPSAPDVPPKAKPELQEVTVRGESGGQSIGVVKLRVQLSKRALPQ